MNLGPSPLSAVPPRLVPRLFPRLLAGAVAVVLMGSVLSGCGGEDDKKAEPKTPQPTPTITVPDGVELTAAGEKLAFGDTANVAFEPNPRRSTVLGLTVESVQQGSIGDLGSYVLDEKVRSSTPYYVKVTVKNAGTGDVGNAPIPLWAVDSANTLIQASTFTNSFTKCPSRALPAAFAPTDEVSTCLVFLLPDRGTLTGVSYRPLQEYAPILWTGTVAPPAAGKKKAS